MGDNNSTDDSFELKLSDLAIISVIWISIIFIGFVGNVLILFLVVTVKKLHNGVNLCLATLAVVDIMVLVLVPITSFIELYGLENEPIGRNFCFFLSCINRGGMVCSTLIFLLVGVERYLVLCYPLKSLRWCSLKRVCLALVTIWAISVGVCIPYGYATSYYEDEDSIEESCLLDLDLPWMKRYDAILNGVFFFLPVPLLVFLYAKIIFALNTTRANGDGMSADVPLMSRSQIPKMLVVLLTIFVTCLLPLKILILIDNFSPQGITLSPAEDFGLFYFFRIIAYVNHAVNPVVYFIMSSNFQDAFIRVFCKKHVQYQDARNA